MKPDHNWSRMPEFTWNNDRSICANFRSVSFANCVITRSALPKVNWDVVRRSLDVLRDDNVRPGFADAEHARQVELAAHGDAPVGEVDVGHRWIHARRCGPGG